MRPVKHSPGRARAHRRRVVLAKVALATAAVITSSACATGASAVAASTYRQYSLYRSASASVQRTPDETFEAAATLLLERHDVEITDLNETHRQCTAVVGDRTLTLRVTVAGAGRSRLSILVGGVDDVSGSQALADRLLQQICVQLEASCELSTPAP